MQDGLVTEFREVMAAVGEFTYQDGRQAICYPSLLNKIMEIGEKYGKNGFQIGAELRRLREQIRRGVAKTPETVSWFPAVLEARFKRAKEPRKVAATATAGSQDASQEVGEGEWAGNFVEGLLREISQARKMTG